MNSSRRAFWVLLLATMGASGNGLQDSGRGTVLWPGTSEYATKIESLPISSDAAHALLVSKTRDHPDRYFDRTPLFIVGDYYFFSKSSKVEEKLQGFYLSGTTGRIEYRKSSVSIEKGDKRIPEGAFTEVQAID